MTSTLFHAGRKRPSLRIWTTTTTLGKFLERALVITAGISLGSDVLHALIRFHIFNVCSLVTGGISFFESKHVNSARLKSYWDGNKDFSTPIVPSSCKIYFFVLLVPFHKLIKAIPWVFLYFFAKSFSTCSSCYSWSLPLRLSLRLLLCL